MALTISSNIASLAAQRYTARSTQSLQTSFGRLASGLRILSAKDDAAGLSISNRFTAQIRGLNQSVRNVNDGISMLQVAEGGLDETTNALQRMRELAVQSANDTYTSSDRASMQLEVDQLVSEINRIASNTEFNNQTLLNGSISAKVIHAGMDASQFVSVTISAATAGALSVSGLSIGTQTTANAALTTLDTAIDSVSNIRAKLGALQNRFESIIANLSNVSENATAARSRMLDADIAQETANLAQSSIRQQAGTAILSQANQQPVLALQLLG